MRLTPLIMYGHHLHSFYYNCKIVLDLRKDNQEENISNIFADCLEEFYLSENLSLFNETFLKQ